MPERAGRPAVHDEGDARSPIARSDTLARV